MRYISVWLGLIILTAAIAVACATPEPITEEIEVTVEVSKIVPQTVEVPVTVVVQQTVEVPVTRLVPQTVEIPVTRIVTPTAPPATATPRPTATPMATPTPTPLPSAWRSFESEADAITGTNRSGLRTSGQMVGSDPHASLYSDPSLFLRCSGETFEVYANWGGDDSWRTTSGQTRFRRSTKLMTETLFLHSVVSRLIIRPRFWKARAGSRAISSTATKS